MSKIKQFITFLIISNLLTLIFIAYSLIQHNVYQDRYLIDEIQVPLVQLQATIQYQAENKWKNPELISFQSTKVQNAIDHVMRESYPSNGKLSKREKSNLFQIERVLRNLPQNSDYAVAKWKKADKQNAVAFEKTLKNVGLTKNAEVLDDRKRFMRQCETVAKESARYMKGHQQE
ncbi:hypothetical protein [Rummeliibacillus suwonensis]|uniref:hypothetical protein n=1 Tax=Rummeliibacillus suwonensis TaxID=1306154 RepID=UPI0011B3A3FA|nr:hypothetical protein [Rummeliibacillus suwonensis]